MNHSEESSQVDALIDRLRDNSGQLETSDAWPGEQLKAMSKAGVLGWLVPTEFGGSERSAIEVVAGYERLAAACLTSTFVLTQRNAAIQRIVSSENDELKADLLPRLANDSLFATVGISHLTTSRQHWKKPTVEVESVDAGYIFNGDIPWVTGADQADFIISGGTLPDGKQVLVAIDTRSEGVSIEPPARLLALNASRTASVRLDNVYVEWSHLLHGPVEQVIKQAGGGAGSFTTSALAIGHAAAAIRLLGGEAERRPDLGDILEPFEQEHASLSADLTEAAGLTEVTLPGHLTAEALRQRSNSLALRATQACLAASKGAGFVQGHPAGRLVNEALFFLVWSCPQPVVMANMREFAGIGAET